MEAYEGIYSIESLHLYAPSLNHPFFQPQFHHLIIAHLPYTPLGIPIPTCSLHLVSQLHLSITDPQTYNRIAGNPERIWFPIAFLNDQLNRLVPFLSLLIVPISDTNKTVTIRMSP